MRRLFPSAPPIIGSQAGTPSRLVAERVFTDEEFGETGKTANLEMMKKDNGKEKKEDNHHLLNKSGG